MIGSAVADWTIRNNGRGQSLWHAAAQNLVWQMQ